MATKAQQDRLVQRLRTFAKADGNRECSNCTEKVGVCTTHEQETPCAFARLLLRKRDRVRRVPCSGHRDTAGIDFKCVP